MHVNLHGGHKFEAMQFLGLKLMHMTTLLHANFIKVILFSFRAIATNVEKRPNPPGFPLLYFKRILMSLVVHSFLLMQNRFLKTQ